MPEKEKKDFAASGTESFAIAGQTASKDHTVLNIQESKTEGVELDKDDSKDKKSGSLFERINNYFISKSSVKVKDKANFFHLLGVMINSGIPMVRALQSLVAQLEKTPRLRMVVEQLAKDIEGGGSLSKGMMKFDKIFAESEIGMIQSGEAAGQLTQVLENLAKDAEKAFSIKSKVKSAMIYPIVIFLLLIAVIVAMMVLVIPKLTELFASTGSELPLITRIVVGMSDFLINKKLLLIVIVFAIVAGFILFKKTETGRYTLDKVKLKFPIFGALFLKAYLSRFARSLSNLLDSNVTIIDTLEITANSIGNEVFRKRLMLSVEDMKQGIPLAENLNESDLFPPMLVNMIDVGEKTAQLDEITAKVAAFYEDEVDTAVAGISKIIEPVILIVIGLSVGLIVAAIMLPIMQLSDISSSA